MLQSKFGRTILGLGFAIIVASLVFAGCGGRGNTDGGSAGDAAGVATEFVSDGGAGATLVITAPDRIPTASRREFFVTATDPSGLPLVHIRLFCESESGIAILEPSSGGVAFEHTGSTGVMSGVLGGLTPGSYLLECRGPQGFNLVARKSLRVVGDVPEGFIGFPGAAGGNLGGGLLIDPPENVTITRVQFQELALVSGTNTATSTSGPLDITRDLDCNDDGTTTDQEDFGVDNYILTIDNERSDRLFVESVTFVVTNSAGATVATSVAQATGLVIDGASAATLQGPFTDLTGTSDAKTFASTAVALTQGTFNVSFRVQGSTGSGSSFSVVQTAAVTLDDENNCP